MALPVNFQDDVLASSMDGKRRYNMISNSDGTVSLEDATVYTQEGSNFGAGQINSTNGAINKINGDNLDSIEEVSANVDAGKFTGALATKELVNNLGGCSFSVESDGKPYITYKVGADTVKKKLGDTDMETLELVGRTSKLKTSGYDPTPTISIGGLVVGQKYLIIYGETDASGYATHPTLNQSLSISYPLFGGIFIADYPNGGAYTNTTDLGIFTATSTSITITGRSSYGYSTFAVVYKFN